MSAYLEIKNTVEHELKIVDNIISESLSDNIALVPYLKNFIHNKAKKIRPLLGILFFKSIYKKELTQKQYQSLAAIELVHSATLIHDDIIDNSTIRRGEETINSKFDNNLAVIAGDYLLSVAMNIIVDLNSHELIKRYTECLKKLCEGEITQYFNKFEVPAKEDYLLKTNNKTAELFALAVISPIITEHSTDKNNIGLGEDFGKNFGMAFQIKNDLKNFCAYNPNLLISNDIANGIYTAPLVLSDIKSVKDLSLDDIFKQVKITKGLEKTKLLIDTYTSNALKILQCIETSENKTQLEKTVNLLKDENEL